MTSRRIEPDPGQESVWDYPRPPAIEPSDDRIRIVAGGKTIAETSRSFRVLETSHPPVYYLPPESVTAELRLESSFGSFCEWKGQAHYYTLVTDDREIGSAAWAYSHPTLRFSAIANWLAFYPSKMEACYVNDERVVAQQGDFYGGWITSKIVGPFKGGPGTRGW